ncbi:hypothetical protein AB1Y20_021149 [Prymnesium parvum]|uniref:PH domain-containing protein n=1 Tax=Prymnesium parvum TaxID=97485 RepID=A0AB34JJJ9_PRYPA
MDPRPSDHAEPPESPSSRLTCDLSELLQPLIAPLLACLVQCTPQQPVGAASAICEAEKPPAAEEGDGSARSYSTSHRETPKSSPSARPPPPPPRPPAVRLIGKLRKQQPSFPYRWQQRYFEGLGSRRESTPILILMYWASESARLRHVRPKGTIVVFSVERIDQLGLLLSAEGGRQVKVRADSFNERERWHAKLSTFLDESLTDGKTDDRLNGQSHYELVRISSASRMTESATPSSSIVSSPCSSSRSSAFSHRRWSSPPTTASAGKPAGSGRGGRHRPSLPATPPDVDGAQPSAEEEERETDEAAAPSATPPQHHVATPAPYVDSRVSGVKVEQLLGALSGVFAQAPEELTEGALKWIWTFIRGIEPFIDNLSFEPEAGLLLELREHRRAEIATRSRVPVCFDLERVVRIRPTYTADSVSFEMDGLTFGPVQGARQLWDALLPEWEHAGIGADIDARAELAWNWWMKHKDEYANTKVWRIIESLAGLRTASLVPRQGFQDLLMGMICVTRTRARKLTFSFFEGKKDDKVQVSCEAEDDPAVFDPQSEDFDPDAAWKRPTSAAIAWRNVNEASKRDLAERFARSGINFSLLFASRDDLHAHNVRGASVDAICKLFEASEAVGGASGLDVTFGALKWQKDDPTFRMTGEHGRIMWVPIMRSEEDQQLGQGH